jgi:signal transduction histidine kinase
VDVAAAMRMTPIVRGSAVQMRAEVAIWAPWPDHWPASIQYRIVREALTNVSKHAGATAAAVSLSGCAGEGLLMEVRNKLPVAGPAAGQSAGGLPGSGLGLVSLAERVALAGGTLAHGPDDEGDFVLTAAFPWEG